MEDLYREHILDHYESPRHQGEIAGADISHEESNPLCGDRIRVDVKLSEDQSRIEDAGFSGDGCIISQAAASMLLEDVVGKPVSEVENMEPQHVLDSDWRAADGQPREMRAARLESIEDRPENAQTQVVLDF